MKPILKLGLLAPVAAMMFIVDAPTRLPSGEVQFVAQAHAIFGVRRRTAVVAYSAGAASATAAANTNQSATAQQQAATAQQQSATAQQQSATAQQQSAIAQQQAAAAQQPGGVPPPSAAGPKVPLGTVVASLPPGCTPTPVGGVEYYYCGGNFYRAVFQGNSLVYVTAEPK
jgi:hypothetical protein